LKTSSVVHPWTYSFRFSTVLWRNACGTCKRYSS
jgi:hypothetical protein